MVTEYLDFAPVSPACVRLGQEVCELKFLVAKQVLAQYIQSQVCSKTLALAGVGGGVSKKMAHR